jgi:septal ring factor EnvC (AmiA/AmiB activator)
MPAQRAWKPGGAIKNSAEIEHLRRQLAAFNARIEQLERQHPEASKIEALRASALVLARQIDEIRCAGAHELTRLLAK